MSDTVIQVENLAKEYRLGVIGTGTLSHDLNRWWAGVRGKPDPVARVTVNQDKQTDADFVWALRDVSFEVSSGEVLGIIGKNGSGKSTLLKILSQVTAPTKGVARVKGRIASLLEVGTGFHPELTGKENVFLNGAILGMTKAEIKKKFDEIVSFSGVEKFIGTPVKRYSSGMKVRLGFAVAAHLEPEILIVDEVLAVGDAEFQRKCLGKMKDVAGEGRTILFVSHNMTAVTSLCTRCLYLREGEVEDIGDVRDIISKYLSLDNAVITEQIFEEPDIPGSDSVKLKRATVVDTQLKRAGQLLTDQGFGLEMEFEVLKENFEAYPNFHIYTVKNEYVLVTPAYSHSPAFTKGVHKVVVWLPGNLLNTGTYLVHVAMTSLHPTHVHFIAKESLIFEIVEDKKNRGLDYTSSFPGIIHPDLKWEKI